FGSIGYRADRAFWVTAFMPEHGKVVRFTDIGSRESATVQGNQQWVWNVPARDEEPAYRVIARGRDTLKVVSVSLLGTGPLSESEAHEHGDREHEEHGHK